MQHRSALLVAVFTLAACGRADVGACCTVASIEYEYEMLESRKNGDVVQSQAYRDRMLEILSHGCDLEDASSCEQLEIQVAGSK